MNSETASALRERHAKLRAQLAQAEARAASPLRWWQWRTPAAVAAADRERYTAIAGQYRRRLAELEQDMTELAN